MKISEIAKIIDGKLVCSAEKAEDNVTSACASDMMSDVLAYEGNPGVLVTGLVNPQVVRTAAMMDIECILFVRGKKPDATMQNLAVENGIVLIATDMKMYEAIGRLFTAGLKY